MTAAVPRRVTTAGISTRHSNDAVHATVIAMDNLFHGPSVTVTDNSLRYLRYRKLSGLAVPPQYLPGQLR